MNKKTQRKIDETIIEKWIEREVSSFSFERKYELKKSLLKILEPSVKELNNSKESRLSHPVTEMVTDADIEQEADHWIFKESSPHADHWSFRQGAKWMRYRLTQPKQSEK